MTLDALAVFCGSSPGNDDVYAVAAATVGRTLAQRGIRLIYGGGNVGLMGVLAHAALEAGGTVIGVIPRSLQEREAVNEAITELVIVDTMHERKTMMADRADAFLALPGGPGTLEELTEQWTWAQLGIHDKACGILNVAGYYDPFIALVQNMRDRGFTHPRYTEMLVIGTEVDDTLDRLADYVPPVRALSSPGAEMTESHASPQSLVGERPEASGSGKSGDLIAPEVGPRAT